LDRHSDVGHQPTEFFGQAVQRRDDHLLETLRFDLDHQLIVMPSAAPWDRSGQAPPISGPALIGLGTAAAAALVLMPPPSRWPGHGRSSGRPAGSRSRMVCPYPAGSFVLPVTAKGRGPAGPAPFRFGLGLSRARPGSVGDG